MDLIIGIDGWTARSRRIAQTVDAKLFEARDPSTDRVTVHGKDLLQLGDREASAIQQNGVCALAEGKARVVTVEVFQRLSDLVSQVLDKS